MVNYQDKRMNIMVGKIGLSEEKALWCLEKSKKYAIWLANQMKTIDLTEKENDVNAILDWKREVQEVNLNELNFKQALRGARDFQKSLFVPNAKGLLNKNVVLDYGEFKWVQLITAEDCREEGSAMGHCIGNSSHSANISNGRSIAFSLRDKFNKPHITLEANKNDGVIFEFKGNSNHYPKAEYLKYFVGLMEKYKLTKITDGTVSVFKDAIDTAKEIIKINSGFFDFRLKFQLGIGAFESGEVHIERVEIVSNDEFIEVPDNVSFYSNLVLNSKKVIIKNNVLIGGNLSINSSNITLGENIQVGGNVNIISPSKKRIAKKEIEKIICFGEKKIA